MKFKINSQLSGFLNILERERDLNLDKILGNINSSKRMIVLNNIKSSLIHSID